MCIMTLRTEIDEYCGGPTMDNSVYYHTIIIGLSCIPTSFWLPLCVHRLGAKFFLGIESIFYFELINCFFFISGLWLRTCLSKEQHIKLFISIQYSVLWLPAP